MLMINKSERGLEIEMNGELGHILAELGLLVAAVSEAAGEKIDVYSALNDPIQKCLTKAYLKAMRSSGAKAKEPSDEMFETQLLAIQEWICGELK